MFVFNERREGNVPLFLVEGRPSCGKQVISGGIGLLNPRIRVLETGQYLRERIGIEHPTNDQLFDFGCKLQAEKGPWAIELEMVTQAQEDYERELIDGLFIDGVRRFGAHLFLKRKYGAVSLFIEAIRRNRYEWKTARKRDAGDALSWEEFVVMDRKQAPELFCIQQHADVQLFNIGTRGELLDSGIMAVRKVQPHLI